MGLHPPNLLGYRGLIRPWITLGTSFPAHRPCDVLVQKNLKLNYVTRGLFPENHILVGCKLQGLRWQAEGRRRLERGVDGVKRVWARGGWLHYFFFYKDSWKPISYSRLSRWFALQSHAFVRDRLLCIMRYVCIHVCLRVRSVCLVPEHHRKFKISRGQLINDAALNAKRIKDCQHYITLFIVIHSVMQFEQRVCHVAYENNEYAR